MGKNPCHASVMIIVQIPVPYKCQTGKVASCKHSNQEIDKGSQEQAGQIDKLEPGSASNHAY